MRSNIRGSIAVWIAAILLVGASVASGLQAQTPGFRHLVTLSDDTAFASGAQDIRFDGQPNRDLGAAVAFGDFDGDGFQDLAVGERKSSRVYIYFGRPFLDPNQSFQDPNNPNSAFVIAPGNSQSRGDVDVTITCTGCESSDPNGLNGAEFGFSLASGDVSGDSIDDLVIGAPFDDYDGVRDKGRAFIVLGHDPNVVAWPSTLDADDGTSAVVIKTSVPEAKDYLLGFAVAVGRIDNDTIDDVAISSRSANRQLYKASATKKQKKQGAGTGAVHILMGGSLAATIDISTGGGGVRTLQGQNKNDFFGESLALCDVDGTAGADLVVGAMGHDNEDPNGKLQTLSNAGAAYIYLSTLIVDPNNPSGGITPGESIQVGDPNDPQPSTILGAGKEDSLGFSVTCGDFNGDGKGDPAVGAFFASGKNDAKKGVGEVFVFHGASTLPALRDLRLDPNSADEWIIGSTPGDQFGFSLSSGDIRCDGDQADDLVVGARRYDNGINQGNTKINAGATYVIRGDPNRPTPFVIDLGPGTYPLVNGARPGQHPTAGSVNPNLACDPGAPDDPANPCAVVAVILGGKGRSEAGFATAAGSFTNSCDVVALGAIAGGESHAYVVSFSDNERDGVSDLSDQDDDNDCLTDVAEAGANGIYNPGETNPLVTDTDQDGLEDGTETGATVATVPPRGMIVFSGTDCSTIDPNAPECCPDKETGATKKTTDPLKHDTDGDGIDDGVEDADHNGEIRGDTDHSGTLSAGEIMQERDPNKEDSDGDGLDDNVESSAIDPNSGTFFHCDPNNKPSPVDADSDDDGLPDGCIPTANGAANCSDKRAGESSAQTNPCLADTDKDGLQDGTEVGVAGKGVPGPNAEVDTAAGQDGTAPSFIADADTNSTTDPLDEDSDDDCLPDGCEGAACSSLPLAPPIRQGEDVNLNGRVDGGVAGTGTAPAAGNETNPKAADTDGDSLPDGLEWGVPIDPNCPVMKGDSDPNTFTDPRDSDTDDGGVVDGISGVNGEDVNLNGRWDFDPNNFICAATQNLDLNNETNPNVKVDDREASFSRPPGPISFIEALDPNNATVITTSLQKETLVVVMRDPDENKDVNSRETILLDPNNPVDPNFPLLPQGVLCLQGDPNAPPLVSDKESVLLTETGNNTGVFKGSLNTDPNGGLPGDGLFNCAANHRTRVAYRDMNDLCDQRQSAAAVTLAQIRALTPSPAADPNASILQVVTTFDEDLSCASVDATDYTVVGTAGTPALDPNGQFCAPDPNQSTFGSRKLTRTFTAALPDDLYTVTLDCDTPGPSINDELGFRADCETACVAPVGGDPAYCTGVLSGNGAEGGTFTSAFVVDRFPFPHVTATTPDPNGFTIDPNVNVTVTFDQAMMQSTVVAPTSWGLIGTMLVPITPSAIGYVAAGSTATYDPSGPLPDDEYTLTLNGPTDHRPNPLDGDNDPNTPGGAFTMKFVEDFDPRPQVATTSPVEGGVTMDPNVSVTVTFDQAMKQSTVVGATWSLIGTLAVPFSPVPPIGYDVMNKVATFDPNGVLPDDRYTLTLNGPTDHRPNPLDGDNDPNTPGGAFNLHFVVDFATPTVMAVAPTDKSRQMSTSGVTIIFSEPMDPVSLIYGTTIFLNDPNGALVTPSSAPSWMPTTKTFSIPLASSLLDGTYSVMVRGNPPFAHDFGPRALDGDMSGTPGGDFLSTFIIDDAAPVVTVMDPNLDSDPNAPRTTIVATFNEALTVADPNAVNPALFTVTNSSGVVPRVSTVYDPNLFTFTFNATTILPDDRYDIVLKGAGSPSIQDLTGNALDGGCSDPNKGADPNRCENGELPSGSMTKAVDFHGLFFMDQDELPRVTASDPNCGVALTVMRSSLQVTFSEPMDPNRFDLNSVQIQKETDPSFVYNHDPNKILLPPPYTTLTVSPDTALGSGNYVIFLKASAGTGITDMAGNFLNGDFPDPNSGGDFVCPFTITLSGGGTFIRVQSTDPPFNDVRGSNNFPQAGSDRRVRIVTTEDALNNATFPPTLGDPNIFTVKDQAGTDWCDTKDVSAGTNVRCLQAPASFVPDGKYTLTAMNIRSGVDTDPKPGMGNISYDPNNFLDGECKNGVCDDPASNGTDLPTGNGTAGGAFTFAFYIDADVFPQVKTMAPDPNAVVNSSPTSVAITFDQTLDKSTLTPLTFTVVGTAGAVTPDGSAITFDESDPNNFQAIFPVAAGLPDDRYSVVLDANGSGTDVRDFSFPSGNPLDGETPCVSAGNPAGFCTGRLSGNHAAGGNFAVSFIVDADDTPTVVLTSPATRPASTRNVLVNSVAVTFSEAMDPSRINQSTLHILGNGSVILNTDLNSVSYDAATFTAIITPDLPLDDGTYHIEVLAMNSGTGVVDMAGNLLDGDDSGMAGGDYPGDFSVEIPPTVTAMDPNSGSTKNTAVSSVVVDFSEAMDPNRLNTTNLLVVSDVDPNIVFPSTIMVDPNNRRVTINLNTALDDGVYRLIIKATTKATDVTDAAGNLLDGDLDTDPGDDFEATFTVAIPPTVTATIPAVGSTTTSPVSTVTVDFSEPMDPTRLTHANLRIVDPNNAATVFSVSAAPDPNSTTRAIISIDPNAPLGDGVYRITIKASNAGTDVIDANGVLLDGNGDGSPGVNFGANFTVSFAAKVTNVTTGSDPNVPGSVTSIVWIFDKAMDPSSTQDPNNLTIVDSASGVHTCSSQPVLSNGNKTLTCSKTTPGFPEDPNYTVTLISGGVKDALLRDLDGDNDNDPGGNHTTHIAVNLIPRVTGMTPSPGTETGAAQSTVLVSFSEAMNPSTIDPNTFTLRGTAGAVPGTVDPNTAGQATFDKGSALLDDRYTVTLVSGGIQDNEGTNLNGEFSGTFPSGDPNAGGNFGATFIVDGDTNPRPIAGTASPLGGSTQTSNVTNVSISFNQAMDDSTFSTSNFTISGANGGLVTPSGPPAYDPNTMRATLSFAALQDDSYTVTLKGSGGSPIRDFGVPTGNPLDGDSDPNTSGGDFPLTFDVDVDQSPGVSATVPPDSSSAAGVMVITVTFDQFMDPNSVTRAGNITLDDTSAPTNVPGMVSYDQATRTATFTPTTAPLPADTYTLTLKGAGGTPIEDLKNHALNGGADLTIMFTATGASRHAAGGASGVQWTQAASLTSSSPDAPSSEKR